MLWVVPLFIRRGVFLSGYDYSLHGKVVAKYEAEPFTLHVSDQFPGADIEIVVYFLEGNPFRLQDVVRLFEDVIKLHLVSFLHQGPVLEFRRILRKRVVNKVLNGL